MKHYQNSLIFTMVVLSMLVISSYANAGGSDSSVTNGKAQKQQHVEENKYAEYMHTQKGGARCVEYDFDPERVVTINLKLTEEEGWKSTMLGGQRLKMNLKTGQFVCQEGGENWNHVLFLDNSKKIRVQNLAGECPDVVLKCKKGYKQLPDGCPDTHRKWLYRSYASQLQTYKRRLL